MAALKNFQKIDDTLHAALASLDDFKWDQWWLRCIEFHFAKDYRPEDQFGWHLHREVQLEVVLRGEFQFVAKGARPIIVRSGDVYIVPPDTVHRWKCRRPGVMLGICLAIPPRADSVAIPLASRLKPSVGKPPFLGELLDILWRDCLTVVESGKISSKSLACWMHLVVTRILDFGLPAPMRADEPEDSSAPASRSRRVVSKIIRFIEANIAGDLSMGRFEETIGLSARQIHRLFIEVTGETCHSYTIKRRIELARSKLQADPSLSIKEVAYASGFGSASHFSSSFKKILGVSPVKYHS